VSDESWAKGVKLLRTQQGKKNENKIRRRRKIEKLLLLFYHCTFGKRLSVVLILQVPDSATFYPRYNAQRIDIRQDKVAGLKIYNDDSRFH
jgi:hypothetical protein